MNAIPRSQEAFELQSLRVPIVISLIFHVAVILVGTLGLPYIRKPPPIIAEPVNVELVSVDELTQTNRPPVRIRPIEEPKEQEPEKTKTPPMPPKVEATEPPKTVPLDPPKPIEKAEKPTPEVPPPSEKLKKPEPEKKPPPKEKEKVVDQEQAFMSVLKNLQDSKPTVQDAAETKKDVTPAPSPLAAFSERLSMSEADALRQQLSRCWSIQAGARYAEDLVVEVQLVMNPDRTVQQATILDKGRYNQDGFFRAAADSAMRAIQSPMCNPLDLPPEKYSTWKDIVVTFDPREML